jgi:signal transduction histidine kinase
MKLSQQVFLRILPTMIITIAIIGALAYRSTIKEINNIYDAELINDANVLWSLLRRPLNRAPSDHLTVVPDLDFNMDNQLALNDDADDFADAHMFRTWRADSLRIVSSNSFPETVPRFKNGFSDHVYANETWRVYSLTVPSTDISIEVGQKKELRAGLVEKILLNLSFPLIILIPIIAFLIWIGINNGLNSIRGLVRQIRSRNPDDLEVISTDGLPSDLMPLAASLNHLFGKLDRSLMMERRFSDLAAHQLRTPQAGIKILIQLLARAETAQERQQLMDDLNTSNERAMRMIEQLLRLARVSHQPLTVLPINLHDLAASAVADFGHVIDLHNLKLELIGQTDAVVVSDITLLRLMFDNILDNAIKYSPNGGSVLVDIKGESGIWILSISDSGPGIPPDRREAVFQRFNRLGGSTVEGAGLGLAIVADIASRLGITVTLGTSAWGNGLKVEMRVPSATPFNR